MSGHRPPLGEQCGPIQCSRLLRFPDEGSRCPRDATHHVIWDEAIENGICCDEHTAEARGWDHFAIHAYEMTCSMPGAMFLLDENRCVVDEDLAFAGTAAAEATA